MLAYHTFIGYDIYQPSSFIESTVNGIIGILQLIGFAIVSMVLVWLVVAFPSSLVRFHKNSS